MEAPPFLDCLSSTTDVDNQSGEEPEEEEGTDDATHDGWDVLLSTFST